MRKNWYYPGVLLAVALLAVSCSVVQERPADTVAVPGPALSPRELEIRDMEAISALLARKDFSEAEARLRGLLAADPSRNEYRILLSSVLVSAGRFPEARQAAREAADAEPGNPDAHMAGAHVERLAGDEKALRPALDRVLALQPAHAGALAAYGDLWYSDRDFKRAEDSYLKALASEPLNLSAILGLGRLRLRQKNAAEAAALFSRAVESHPRSSQALADRSRSLYRLGRYRESLADLHAAIRLDPDVAWFRIERGRFLLDLGREKEALADFDEAIRLDPDFFLPYVYRSGILELEGRDEEARADHRRIVALNPEYWYAFESIGITSFRLGDFPAAREGFERAFSNAPSRIDYAILAVISAYRSGQPAEGRNLATRFLARVNRETHNLHWLVLRLLQDRNDAVSELENRISRERSLDIRAKMLFYLGQYWIIQGRTSLGVRHLILVRDMGREGILEQQLLTRELERLVPVS